MVEFSSAIFECRRSATEAEHRHTGGSVVVFVSLSRLCYIAPPIKPEKTHAHAHANNSSRAKSSIAVVLLLLLLLRFYSLVRGAARVQLTSEWLADSCASRRESVGWLDIDRILLSEYVALVEPRSLLRSASHHHIAVYLSPPSPSLSRACLVSLSCECRRFADGGRGVSGSSGAREREALY